ncbi:MAG: ABC transporter substrate-binding protein, partial [Candidatus Rokuibacteriota bacterium]
MRREVVAGVSLALSGELRLQGREAARGLRLWCACVGEGGGLDLGPATPRLPLRLVVLDDEGRITRAAENTRILLTRDRVDLLVGPYGSHLMRAVARLAEAQGRVVWNHGGASDAIVEQGLRNVVSVPSPASEYFRDLPALVRRRDAMVRRLAIVHSSRGSFAAEVARGVGE